MRQRGARVLLAAPDDIAERDLTLSRAEHPAWTRSWRSRVST
jgi:glucosamine--fructose-6-phosphate aminotransferase (isomerizing)